MWRSRRRDDPSKLAGRTWSTRATGMAAVVTEAPSASYHISQAGGTSSKQGAPRDCLPRRQGPAKDTAPEKFLAVEERGPVPAPQGPTTAICTGARSAVVVTASGDRDA